MSGSIKRHALVGLALLALNAGLPQAALAGPVADRQKSNERIAFTAGEAAAARPEGLRNVRIGADDPRAFQALIDGASAAGEPWLVLSGGGENGAFAAGLLNGWSAAGTRPAFGIITGVSTGAMIAPFAFVGRSEDGALARAYTEVSAADVFEFGATPESLTDTWPLKRRIDRSVTPQLLSAIAAEHAKGRRLLVATTAVDSERPVLWDMGALASAGGPKAIELFRAIILASSAVPGVFPPVLINAVGPDGRSFQEMHDDGGTMAPFYLAPEAALLGQDSVHLPTRTIYLVVNNKLTPDFQVAARTTLSVLGRSMSAAIKAQTRAALALSRAFADRTGLDLRVAQIDGRFTQTSAVPFDQKYMKALFAHGEALGRAGTAFGGEAPAGTVGRDVPTSSVKGVKATQRQPAATQDLAQR